MTTVQISLPDRLAQEVERAGLLSPEAVEEMFRRQLRTKAAADLLSELEKTNSALTEEDFSPEAMAEEVRAMRAERRAVQKAS
jgi:Arc/MetJ family transcription regulator